jgi:hypothetical protein
MYITLCIITTRLLHSYRPSDIIDGLAPRTRDTRASAHAPAGGGSQCLFVMDATRNLNQDGFSLKQQQVSNSSSSEKRRIQNRKSQQSYSKFNEECNEQCD